MEKTVTITEDMYTAMVVALKAQKRHIQERRAFAADRDLEEIALLYEEDIQNIDQVLERIMEAKWEY